MKRILNKTVLLTIITAILVLMPMLVYGYTPLAPLPGLGCTTTDKSTCVADTNCGWNDAANTCAPLKEALLSEYLSALFRFTIVTASILAVIVIVIAGLKYIGAAGNPSIISDAKDQMYWAVLGLILALSSWMILSTINPKLLELKLGVNPTKEILPVGFEGLFNGTYCSTFATESECDANNTCKWSGASCGQKPCIDYTNSSACTNNPTCNWTDKCQTGAMVTSACHSLSRPDCGSTYCTWFTYPGICGLQKHVFCNYGAVSQNCNTGICGLDSVTKAVCCVGTTENCVKDSTVTTTP